MFIPIWWWCCLWRLQCFRGSFRIFRFRSIGSKARRSDCKGCICNHSSRRSFCCSRQTCDPRSPLRLGISRLWIPNSPVRLAIRVLESRSINSVGCVVGSRCIPGFPYRFVDLGILRSLCFVWTRCSPCCYRSYPSCSSRNRRVGGQWCDSSSSWLNDNRMNMNR